MSEELVAQQLISDPRTARAKQLLLETLKDCQKQITGIRPPLPSKKTSYEALLKEYASYRGAKLYYPYLGSGIGKGALVELLDGSVKYDFITGIGVHFLGHSHPLLLEAAFESALSDIIMQGHLQQNADAMELSKLLIEASGLDHCFLSSSGAMANENAFKLAFQKKNPSTRVFAFERCFAGRTLALSQVTDKPAYRIGLPNFLPVDYIPFYDPQKPEESTLRAKNVLKKYIQRYPKQHALFCMELIQGEGGYYTAAREFFIELLAICKDNQIAIFFDEVQTFGRTNSLFAFQHYNLQEYADIVSLGKLSQTCATLFRKEMAPGPGLLSQTFTSSTAAIKSSKAIIEHLLQGKYFGPDGKNAQIERRFAEAMTGLQKRYPESIEGPFGIGAMAAFTTCKGDPVKTAVFAQALFEKGVIGFVAGSEPTRIRFLIPSGAIELHEIDLVVEVIEQTLRQIHEKEG